MLPENETITYEDRLYLNPETSLNEQLSFIDNLRAVQQANNAEIRNDTYNLGTAVPSNLGGLIGGEGYFTSRYQVPQSVAAYNDLTAAARASALNQALKNEQEKWNQRYRRARSANYRRSNTPTTPTAPLGSKDDIKTVGGGNTAGLDRMLSEIEWKKYLAAIEAEKQRLKDKTAQNLNIAPVSNQNKDWQLPVPTYQGGF